MKNTAYILLSFLLVFAGCKKVDKVETYQVKIGETTVTTGSDNVGIEAAYTYDYTLKSARLQYSDDSELENAVSLAAQFADGVLKATATGLKPATTYFYRFELDNGITRMWTETRNFRTSDAPVVTKLIVTTAEVSGVTDTVAVCGGKVVCEGDTTVIARGVCYGLSENPSLDDCTGKTVDGGGPGTFTSVMTGLERETRYYVKAYATNDDTTCYGEQRVFTTLGQVVYSLPTVVTNAVDETTIGQYSAMLSGVVTDDGNKPVTGCGFWYSTGHDTLGGITRPAAYSAGGFSLNVSDGIVPNKTYYARAYAENEIGRRFGNEVSFTTLSLPPVPDPQVFTLPSSGVTTNSATIKGRIYYDGTENPIKKGFLYGTDVNDMNSDIDCTSQTDPFEAELTGLTPNTTYYYEAYAIFTGYPQTFYGGIESFTTQQNITLPTVTTNNVSDIAQTTATGGGNVTNDGGATVTARGICWSTSPNPTVSNSHTTDGTGTGTFTSLMTGLTANTTYYVRAYATNSEGTAYGEQKSFAMPDLNGHECIDLGLPSGLLWATCNVGADSPEDYGDYFAWGETETKSTYNWSTYKWCNGSYNTLTKYCTKSHYGSVDNKTVLDPEDDAAHVNWGGSWRMPTYDEEEELVDNCTWTWTTQGGNNGYLVTGPNGNSIFLPAAGCYNDVGLVNVGSTGNCSSSSLAPQVPESANHVFFMDGLIEVSSGYRSIGRSVRPVSGTQVASAPTVTTSSVSIITQTTATGGGYVTSNGGATVTERGVCWSMTQNPTVSDSHTIDGTGIGTFTSTMSGLTANTTYYVRAYAVNSAGTAYGEQKSFTTQNGGGGDHDYVDLGLPSGLLWATCNVGASSPGEYGNYFAWGETTTKSEYNWSNYQWCNGSPTTLTKYNTDSDYGIVDNKTILEPEDDAAHVNWGGNWRMPTRDDMEELKNNCTWMWTTLGGKNGFLVIGPSGNGIFLPAGSLNYAGIEGDYWSSSLHTDAPGSAYILFFRSEALVTNSSRASGQLVRPVCQSQN